MSRKKRNPKERLLLTRCVDCGKEILIYASFEEARSGAFRCVLCFDKYLTKSYGKGKTKNPKRDWRDFVPLIIIAGGLAYTIWYGHMREAQQGG